MELRRGLQNIGRSALAGLIMLGLFFVFAGPVAVQSASPQLTFVWDPNVGVNQEQKKDQIVKVIQKLQTSYPEIPVIRLDRVYITTEIETAKACESDTALACYRPYDRSIILIGTQSDDITIMHELMHASIVDTSGSVVGSYYDAIEEGLAEVLAVNLSGRGANRGGYPDIEGVINHLGQVLQTVTGNPAINELRKIAFTEGKQAGINRRLSEYVSSTDPYATLNYYLKQKQFSAADEWLSKIAANYRAKAVGAPDAVRFEYVTAKSVPVTGSSDKSAVVINWKTTNPTASYLVNIEDKGMTKASASGEDAQKGEYTYQVARPYSSTVDVQLLTQKDGASQVVDTKTLQVKADTDAASPTVTGLSLVAGKVTGYVTAKDKANVSWVTNRDVAATETIHLKVYNGADGALLADSVISGSTGELAFSLKGAKKDDRITAQLIDKKTNKQMGNSVKLQLAASAADAASAGSPAPKATDSNDCSQGGSFTFCETLFGEKITAAEYLLKAYYWAVGVAIFGAAAAITFAGYKYAMSRGNPSELTSAKEIIISAIIGLVLLLLSYAILRFLGINIA